MIDDNAAGPGRVKKTVYVSQATFTLSSGQVVSQPANLVRRVINGSGELVYRNWEDSGLAGHLLCLRRRRKPDPDRRLE